MHINESFINSLDINADLLESGVIKWLFDTRAHFIKGLDANNSFIKCFINVWFLMEQLWDINESISWWWKISLAVVYPPPAGLVLCLCSCRAAGRQSIYHPIEVCRSANQSLLEGHRSQQKLVNYNYILHVNKILTTDFHNNPSSLRL